MGKNPQLMTWRAKTFRSACVSIQILMELMSIPGKENCAGHINETKICSAVLRLPDTPPEDFGFMMKTAVLPTIFGFMIIVAICKRFLNNRRPDGGNHCTVGAQNPSPDLVSGVDVAQLRANMNTA